MRKRKLEKKIQAIAKATGGMKPGSVCHISVEHEDGCPAIITQSLADCKCTPVIRRMPSRDAQVWRLQSDKQAAQETIET